MASHTERGIANILAHFASLISFCIGYGAKYNPANAALTVKSLQALYDAANQSLTDVKTAKAALQTVVKDRKEIFKPLKHLCTQIINALIACDAAEEIVNNAKTENNKIQGSRAEAIKPSQTPAQTTTGTKEEAVKAETGDTEEKHISASQQSFDQLVDHFAQLVQILAAEPKYTPNETELQTATLQTLADDLKTANQAEACAAIT